MTLRRLMLSVLLVAVLPAHRDAAKACVQQDDGTLPALEQQLSKFLEDLSQTFQGQEGRMLALEQQNKGLLQAINQQGAAHMQELGAVREAVEAAVKPKLKAPSDVGMLSVIAKKATSWVQDSFKTIILQGQRLMPAFYVPWFVMKLLLLMIGGQVCMDKAMEFADRWYMRLRHHRAPSHVGDFILFILITLGVYLVCLFIVDLFTAFQRVWPWLRLP